MHAIWKSLGKAKLQQLIGAKQLDELARMLPGLRKSEFEQSELYSLDGLAQIFDAFYGNQLLQQNDFRKSFFNTLPPALVDDSLSTLGEAPASFSSFEQKIDILAQKGWKTRNNASKIASILNIPEDALPEEKNETPIIVDIQVTNRPYKPLKDYQMTVFSEASERLHPELARFIVQMPTGSGKTRTAIEIITHFLKEQIAPGGIVLWLAHSEELCEQAMASFLDIWPHVATKQLKAIKFWGEVPKIPNEFPENAFVVSSFQKMHSMVKSKSSSFDQLKDRVSLIIVDEAHKILAKTYKEVTERFISNKARVIGLTATPGRSVKDKEQNLALADFFFNELIEIHAPKKESVLSYLRGKKVLASTEYDPLQTGLTYSLSTAQKKYLEDFFDLPKDFLAQLGDDETRNVEIVKKLEQECLQNKRIIFFACSLAQSRFISALLRFMKIKSAHVDGSTPKRQRQSIINKFKSGELAVLCNYEVLATGFDAPQTDVVFIARPTSSIVLYSQMIGRGLRGPAIGGTETCKIIDVKDNIRGFSNEDKVYRYFEGYYR